MNSTACNGYVNQLVQAAPAASELTDGPVVGGQRERHKQREAYHADGDEWTPDDIGDDGRQVQALIEHHISREMHQRIIEGEQAECAPIAQKRNTRQIAYWRNE